MTMLSPKELQAIVEFAAPADGRREVYYQLAVRNEKGVFQGPYFADFEIHDPADVPGHGEILDMVGATIANAKWALQLDRVEAVWRQKPEGGTAVDRMDEVIFKHTRGNLSISYPAADVAHKVRQQVVKAVSQK